MAAVSNKELLEHIEELREEMAYIRSILAEDFELSEHAKREMKEARKTPTEEYVDLDDL